MKKICKIIKKSNSIALFSHENPDADTIGSTTAFALALEKLGKNVDVFCDCEFNEKFSFLKYYDRYNTSQIDENNYDLFISVDVPSEGKLGKFQQVFENFDNTIRIDHHQSCTEFAKINYMKPVSACAINIFEFINKLKVKVDSDIATNLYFAICGDTGLFKNNNLDSKTFEICAKLLELGADYRKIYTEFFDKRTVENVRLVSNTLLNAKLNDEFKYAVMSISSDDFKKFNTNDGESVSNLPHTYLSCGYKIAVILREKEDGIHCSFRSKFEYDCSVIAEKFGGGGHKNASGCTINETMSKATKMVEDEIKNYLTKGENKC